MYHAADHTMSNVMANIGLWDEEFVRLDKLRQKKGIWGSDWREMQAEARLNAKNVCSMDTAKRSFLKGLAQAITEK